ncbi:3D-(3,5/4)-trihydroxycyclohexane-1,2-dione acylhydrolase (decyclizing) [Helicobacter apodemus]|uniref:3D-(3,5/4)-trihydroxycyclohexane-1,2-dione acylhydrolase (Decyclizing) n=1 Tax=Helicobacter apodemus TaxID=135569 RepID=A0A2U8FDX1_9HELI|nr:3D-(3,5/4)-trihydroxycyclohexane-1,2-dione acylhydrolase (decyclizing) [Helicobacter apodemus]AWI34451.1 3D-(3,5/4)-trihydroxycyclohexane-1,2-dione acylhydrolase (decyclizing) [Helicobacter apodemus]
MKTIKLTVGQAIVKYLMNQYIEINNKEERLFYGGFGIFGHGNVTCLAEALYDVKDEFPTYRGQNEQSMALAAIGYAKAKNRKRIMFATSSIGPGATNMITACGVAYTNSLPLLILSGDYFNSRLPSPVLQQIEQSYDPTLSANDCFKPIVKYWDRITQAEQIMQSLPMAIETMLNPSTCGPVFIGLCQDIQAQAYEFPQHFFDKKLHIIPRQRADKEILRQAVMEIQKHNKIAIIAGAGLIYSEAQKEFLDFVHYLRIPYATTVSAKSLVPHNEPYNIGPIGVLGSCSANELVKSATLILAIGTRLQDFTTASWSNFKENTKIISINANAADCVKHSFIAICADAKEALIDLKELCALIKIEETFLKTAFENKNKYNQYIEEKIQEKKEITTYANVIGAINALATPKDRIILAAGGLPGEFNTLWRNLGFNSIDHEYGFSCMGYEISGGYGSAIAHKEGDTIVLVGDGSYMMLNSEIYSSVLSGDKMIIVVCDNEGYAVINRLQINQGGEPFNNLIEDCKMANKPFMTDFVMNAKSMGAEGVFVYSIEELKEAFKQARESKVSFLIHVKVSKYDWSEYSNVWWQVGVPEVSHKESIQKARIKFEENFQRQRKGV